MRYLAATATAKDPRSRYQQVDEFVEAFVQALAESPAAPAAVHEAARRVTEPICVNWNLHRLPLRELRLQRRLSRRFTLER